MKPIHIKAKRLKEVRQIHKRQNEIWRQMNQLGYRKLDKPIRHGWIREILLTPEIHRYKNADQYLEIFDKFKTEYWGRTKSEANDCYVHHVTQFIKNKPLPTLSRKSFNKLSRKAQLLCTAFEYYTKEKKRRVRFYVNFPNGTYVIKNTRAYVTHSRIIDPELNREFDLLEQRLQKHGWFEANRKGEGRFWCHHLETRALRREKREMKQMLRQLTFV